MDKGIMRRRFLKQSVITMGSIVIFNFSLTPEAESSNNLKSSTTANSKEPIIPHISVKLYLGRSEPQKARMAEAIARSVVETIQCSMDSISVAIEEVDASEWKEKVYLPEVVGKADKLYKKPGYSM